MSMFGIDISRYQKGMNLANAKAEGVQFAIIKAGGGDAGLYKDSQFETHYQNAIQNGLHAGAYFFGAAKTVEAAKSEADMFISLLKGKKFDMPVYYDVEGAMLKVNKNLLTDIVFEFCNTVEKAGYYTGIYASESSFNSNMIDSKLTHFCHWVARWSTTSPNLKSKMTVGVWQFGGETNLIRSNIIDGRICDQDYCYVDYPTRIKSLGLNGYEAPKQEEQKEEQKEDDAKTAIYKALEEISRIATEALKNK